MDWTENQQCVLCDKGGNLLFCNDDGCPIAVHKNCMGCEAHIDDDGNFHCPYCVYKQYAAEASRLKSKVKLTKKALSTFLEAEKRDDNRQEPIVDMANKEYGTSSKGKLVEENCSVNLEMEMRDDNHQEPIVEMANKDKLVDENRSVNLEAEMRDDNHQEPIVQMANKDEEPSVGMANKDKLVDENRSVSLDAEMRDDNHQEPIVEMANKDKVVNENHSVGLEKGDEIDDAIVPETPYKVYNQNEDRVCDVNTCRMMVVYQPNAHHADARNQLHSGVRKRMKVDQQTGNGECRSKVVDQANQSKSADILLTADKKITFKYRDKSVTFNMNGKKEEPVKEHAAKQESKQLSMINRNKRCRVFWSEQEEEILKEGVQKYSLVTKKNLPWKKILEFGRHVFDSSRTPSELKDKWRYIAK